MASLPDRRYRLSTPVTLWRVGHAAFPLWTGLGASLRGGRWNSPGNPVIYTSVNYSLCLLEVLVNLSARQMPSGFVRSSATMPAGVSAERVLPADVPQWRDPRDPGASRFGDRWLAEQRSLLLYVPSAVVEGIEENVLINPAHPEMPATAPEAPVSIGWDFRLFPSASTPGASR